MLRGQFTYTACQAPGPYSQVPGWKVKQVQPFHSPSQAPGSPSADQAATEALMPAEVVKMAARPFGSFRPPPIPRSATSTEIAELDRALRLDLLPGTLRSVAHLAAAGRDHSHREAFFAHSMVLDISQGAESLSVPLEGSEFFAGADPAFGVLRPADLWQADGWLDPIGADAIESTVIGVHPKASEFSPLQPDLWSGFLEFHHHQREFVFAAAERALTTGQPLAIVGMPGAAATWISVITHFMVPTVGWSVPFSTFERVSSGQTLLDSGLKIAGVPTEDLAVLKQLPGSKISILEPGTTPLREQGGFRLHDGTLLPIGPWAQLAERVFGQELEGRIRMELDQLGRKIGTSSDSAPLWGLTAALVLVAADSPESLEGAELAGPAADLMIQHLPSSLMIVEDGTAGRLVATAVKYSGTPRSAFHRLLAALDAGGRQQPGSFGDGLLNGYLRSLMTSPTAFAQSTMPWLPQHVVPSSGLISELYREIPAWKRALADLTDTAHRVRWLLTLVDLGTRFGWIQPDGSRLPAEFADVVAEIATSFPSLLVGGVPLTDNTWPRIPKWLWYQHVSPVLTSRLPDLSRSQESLAEPAYARPAAPKTVARQPSWSEAPPLQARPSIIQDTPRTPGWTPQPVVLGDQLPTAPPPRPDYRPVKPRSVSSGGPTPRSVAPQQQPPVVGSEPVPARQPTQDSGRPAPSQSRPASDQHRMAVSDQDDDASVETQVMSVVQPNEALPSTPAADPWQPGDDPTVMRPTAASAEQPDLPQEVPADDGYVFVSLPETEELDDPPRDPRSRYVGFANQEVSESETDVGGRPSAPISAPAQDFHAGSNPPQQAWGPPRAHIPPPAEADVDSRSPESDSSSSTAVPDADNVNQPESPWRQQPQHGHQQGPPGGAGPRATAGGMLLRPGVTAWLDQQLGPIDYTYIPQRTLQSWGHLEYERASAELHNAAHSRQQPDADGRVVDELRRAAHFLRSVLPVGAGGRTLDANYVYQQFRRTFPTNPRLIISQEVLALLLRQHRVSLNRIVEDILAEQHPTVESVALVNSLQVVPAPDSIAELHLVVVSSLPHSPMPNPASTAPSFPTPDEASWLTRISTQPDSVPSRCLPALQERLAHWVLLRPVASLPLNPPTRSDPEWLVRAQRRSSQVPLVELFPVVAGKLVAAVAAAQDVLAANDLSTNWTARAAILRFDKTNGIPKRMGPDPAKAYFEGRDWQSTARQLLTIVCPSGEKDALKAWVAETQTVGRAALEGVFLTREDGRELLEVFDEECRALASSVAGISGVRGIFKR